MTAGDDRFQRSGILMKSKIIGLTLKTKYMYVILFPESMSKGRSFVKGDLSGTCTDGVSRACDE